MSLTITSGLLSCPEPQKVPVTSSLEMNITRTLQKVAPEIEIVEIHPEREEILLKFHNQTTINSEVIRIILRELQVQTHRSFAALVNLASQQVLVTVRG